MNKIYGLALRYLRQSRQRTVTTIVGVMLSTMLLYIVFTCGYSGFNALSRMEYQRTLGWDALFACDGEQADGILSLAPYYNRSSVVDDAAFPVSHAFMMAEANFAAINDFNAMPIPFPIDYGTEPKSGKELLLTRPMAITYYKCSVGDIVQIFTYARKEVEEYIVSGICGDSFQLDGGISFREGYDNSGYILMNDEDFRVADEEGRLNVFVTFENKENIKQQAVALANTFGIEDYRMNESALSCFAEQNDSLAYLFFEALLLVIAAVCAVTVMFIVRNAFNISVHERQNDYGVLRCIGMSRRQIIGVILCESAVISAIGIVLGILLGHGLSVLGFMYVREYFSMPVFFKAHLYPKAFICTIIYALVTSCYAMVAPIEQLYRINPIEALRHADELKRGKPKAKRGKKLEKLFGVEVGYAYKNVLRRKGHFIISVVSLSLVTVLFVGVSSCLTTADKWCRDFYKLSEYDGEFEVRDYDEAQDIMSDMRQLNTTKKMALRWSFKGSMQAPNNSDQYIRDGYLGLDSESFQDVLDKADISEKREGRNVLNVICIKGSKRGGTTLHTGDSFLIQNGDDEVTVYLYGEISKAAFEEIDRKYQGRYYGSDIDYSFVYEVDGSFDGFVWCEEGYSYYMMDRYVLVKLSTQQSTKKFDTYLTETLHYYDDFSEVEQGLVDKLEIIRFIVGIVLILFLAIFVTNVINVNRSEMLLRRRELRMMRIVGMSYKQESRMLYSESIIAAIFSLIIGSVVGVLAAGWVVWTMFLPYSDMPEYNHAFVPSWSSMLISLAVLLVFSLVSVFLSREEN